MNMAMGRYEYVEPEATLSRLYSPFVAITQRLQIQGVERFGSSLHSIYLYGDDLTVGLPCYHRSASVAHAQKGRPANL